MTSASDEKWPPFNCFFQSDRAKDLSAPLYTKTCSLTPQVQAPILSEFQQSFQVDTKSFQAERVFDTLIHRSVAYPQSGRAKDLSAPLYTKTSSFTLHVQAPILSEFQQWFQVDTNSFQAERVFDILIHRSVANPQSGRAKDVSAPLYTKTSSFTLHVEAPILSEFQQWFQVDTNSFQAERVLDILIHRSVAYPQRSNVCGRNGKLDTVRTAI